MKFIIFKYGLSRGKELKGEIRSHRAHSYNDGGSLDKLSFPNDVVVYDVKLCHNPSDNQMADSTVRLNRRQGNFHVPIQHLIANM